MPVKPSDIQLRKLRKLLKEVKNQGDKYSPIYKNKYYRPNMIILSKGKKRKTFRKRKTLKKRTFKKRTFKKRKTYRKKR